MSDDVIDHLKSLHTGAVDARNGYDEALRDADGKGMTTLFQEMIALHTKNADELSAILMQAGEQPDADGSFMSTVHRIIMSARALFDGLDESVLPGLIDGEQRNVTHFDEALALPALGQPIRDALMTQRARLAAAIAVMQSSHALQPKKV